MCEQAGNSYMGVPEAAKKWEVPEEKVRKWCREGLVFEETTVCKYAEQDAPRRPWRIPIGAKCPER